MKKVKVLLDFLRLPIPGKVEFGRNTVTRMTGNISFPTPDVPLAQVTTACNNLETAYNAAQGGGKQQTAALHQAEKAWEDLLRRVAAYVDRIALGNDVMILSAGFNTTHQPVSRLNPDFSVERGEQSGEVILKHKAFAGRSAWIWQMSETPDTTAEEWKTIGTTLQATFIVNNLKPTVKYWFRAALVTTAGQQDWCEPHSVIVL
ncbi:MAG: hypothetical protein V2A54_07770 [Bacteroidota bacterium]